MMILAFMCAARVSVYSWVDSSEKCITAPQLKEATPLATGAPRDGAWRVVAGAVAVKKLAVWSFRPLIYFAACGIISAMNSSISAEGRTVCSNGTPESFSIIIFGASGDLTARKLIPALYHLCKDNQMPPDFRVIGFARREKTEQSWRQELRTALDQFSRTKPVDDQVWAEFSKNIFYCVGDMTDAAAYAKLEQKLSSFNSPALRQNLLFYLATQPSQFGVVAEQLPLAKLLQTKGAGGGGRIIVEKPFGHDLASAQTLNNELTRFANEPQVFRIDHYLGKETVQNILMFRFSNSIFEQLWNRNSVDHVQLTVSEKIGVGDRGGYYEEAGAIRDMVQNHMLQVLSLIAMEPPVSLEAESVRNEKVKLLKSIRPLTPEDVARQVVRGQYFAGIPVDGQAASGSIASETKVNPNSNVETYVALKTAHRRKLALERCAVLFADRQKSSTERQRSPHSIPSDPECIIRGAMRVRISMPMP